MPETLDNPAAQKKQMTQGVSETPKTQTKAPKDRSSELDDSNIVPERVKRTRVPSRRQAYMASLDQTEQGEAAFHAAFSALIPAVNYYTVENPREDK